MNLGIELETDPDHTCNSRFRELSERESEILDDLSDPVNILLLEDKLEDNCKQNLVYIAGYIQRKLVYEDCDEGGSYNYFNLYSKYFTHMNRGGLTKPVDCLVQWVFISYFLFLNLENRNSTLCRKSLSHYFQNISDIHELNVHYTSPIILSNILLNNLCKLETPVSTKEVKQKAAKLNDCVDPLN